MDFEEARRIFRGFDLPKGGFEEVLAKLDLLKGSDPAGSTRSFPRQTKGAKVRRTA